MRVLALLGFLFASPALGQTHAELTAGLPPGFSVIEEIDRFMFATAEGMALYTLDDDKEKPGTSTCEFGGLFVAGGLAPHCAHRFPPVFAPEGAQPKGDWTIIKRPEGAMQWAYKGQPVYLSHDDITPGIDSSDNQGQRWHTLAIPRPAPTPKLPPGMKVQKGGNAWIVADILSRPLYVLKDGQKAAGHELAPVGAAMLALPIGDWTVIKNPDGTKQWAFKGKALYIHARPGDPGEDLAGVIEPVGAS